MKEGGDAGGDDDDENGKDGKNKKKPKNDGNLMKFLKKTSNNNRKNGDGDGENEHGDDDNMAQVAKFVAIEDDDALFRQLMQLEGGKGLLENEDRDCRTLAQGETCDCPQGMYLMQIGS